MDSLHCSPHTDRSLLCFSGKGFSTTLLGVKVHHNQHFQANSSISDCCNLKISDSAAAIKTKTPVNVIVWGKLTVILTKDDH